MKENSKIRENDFDKLASELAHNMYRKDIYDLYLEFIKDNNINKFESILIREYIRSLVVDNSSNRRIIIVLDFKESYYHMALKFHDKIAIKFTNRIFSIEDFYKKNKLRLNESVVLSHMTSLAVDFSMKNAHEDIF